MRISSRPATWQVHGQYRDYQNPDFLEKDLFGESDGFNGFQTNISATLVQGSCFLAKFVSRPRPF